MIPVELLQSIKKSWRDLKARYLGDEMWSGPGMLRTSSSQRQAIEDVSFFHQGGPDAVLLIHGLTGTPTEMRFIGKSLAASGYTVHGMQLAGHCGSEEDLLHTTWHDWYASVEAAYLELTQKYQRVYVAGLSMGALLAMHLARHHPVHGIALYSTTLWYDGWSIPRLSFLLPLFLYTPLGESYRFTETFPYGIKDERLRKIVVAGMMSGDSAAAGNLGMAGRSLRQLRSLIRVVKSEMPKIKTPTLILHARDDDVTSLRNANYVERRLSGPVQKILLDDCYHIITVDRQRHTVAKETARFFAECSQQHMVKSAAE